MTVTLPEGLSETTYRRGRNAAAQLGRFTVEQFAEAAGYTLNTAYVVVAKLKTAGVVCGGGQGAGNQHRPAVYEYVKPAPQRFVRHREAPPEVVVQREAVRLAPVGSPVTAARRRRKLRREVTELLDLALDAGWLLKDQKHGTLVSRPDGFPVTAIPHTPSDHRSLQNCRADLARAGMPGLARAEAVA